MNANDIALAVVEALERLGIPHMLVGSFSSNLWGIPRSTKDADIIIELRDHSAGEIVKLLGSDYRLDPQMSFETVTATVRYKIRHPASAFTVELFLLSMDPHDRSRFDRRVAKPLGTKMVNVATAEDVIITKLRWAKVGKRQKDLDDVKDVIEVQTPGKLDLAYIRHWCDQHGTRELFEQLLAQIPPQSPHSG